MSALFNSVMILWGLCRLESIRVHTRSPRDGFRSMMYMLSFISCNFICFRFKFGGDHNSPCPQFYFDSVSIFFRNVLSPPEDMSDEQSLIPATDFTIMALLQTSLLNPGRGLKLGPDGGSFFSYYMGQTLVRQQARLLQLATSMKL